MKLTGNTIFITGGGSGIGRGLAEALHKLGNKVIISGRRKPNLDAVIAANPGMEAVELDISDPASIDAVAKKLVAEHPELNVLFNNAGIMEVDHADGTIDESLLTRTVTTNLLGPIRLTSTLVQQLKSRRGVVIYNTRCWRLCHLRLLLFIRRRRPRCIPMCCRNGLCCIRAESGCWRLRRRGCERS